MKRIDTGIEEREVITMRKLVLNLLGLFGGLGAITLLCLLVNELQK